MFAAPLLKSSTVVVVAIAVRLGQVLDIVKFLEGAHLATQGVGVEVVLVKGLRAVLGIGVAEGVGKVGHDGAPRRFEG